MASAHRPLARDERERRSIGSETAALRRVRERVASLRPCDWRSSEAGASLVPIWATAFTAKAGAEPQSALSRFVSSESPLLAAETLASCSS